MTLRERRVIPIARDADNAACDGAEPFALRVLGEAMAPEFVDGDIVVVEPGGLATDGAYVIAFAGGEWMLRQLVGHDGRWTLRALDARYPAIDIAGLDAVRGVVIQRSRPGERRHARRYGPA